MIKLSILRWGDFPGFPGWTGCNHRGGRLDPAEDKMPVTKAEAKIEDELLLASRPQAKGHRWPPEARKGQKQIFLLKPLEGMQSCTYLGRETASDSDLQSLCKIINVHDLKSPGLCQSDPVATGN